MFQVSDGKGKQFLDLLDNNSNAIELSYVKGGPWLQMFGQSNSLCMCAMRAITNHAPIGEYKLRFFSIKNYNAHVMCIPSNQRDIFSMSIADSMAIEIR